MAKKQSKHSRAARRALEEPEVEIEDVGSDNESSSGKTKVLEQIAIKELREKGHGGANKPEPALPEGMDELTALSLGLHPEQAKVGSGSPAGRVGKSSAKKNKRNKKKQDRALMVKDMLNEKIEQAQTRHKTVRSYRSKEEEEESKEKESKNAST